MRKIQSQITIDRPIDEVWKVLSDLTAMKNYMPGIVDVTLISEKSEGIGTTRYCRFEDGIELQEEVVDWNEKEGYTLKTTLFKKVPMRSNVITFYITTDKGKTLVTQSMQYRMKGWIFAPIMERMAGGMMKKALQKSLDGLKHYMES